MALRDGSLWRTDLVDIGGIADMARSLAARWSDANGPDSRVQIPAQRAADNDGLSPGTDGERDRGVSAGHSTALAPRFSLGRFLSRRSTRCRWIVIGLDPAGRL